jgi:hypothetical protein
MSILSSGDPSEHSGITFLLTTASSEGRPHLAMLSIGEVLSIDSRRLGLAMWPKSTPVTNLTPKGSQALVTLVERGQVWGVRIRSESVEALTVAGFPDVMMVQGPVDEVLLDSVEYAVVQSGVRFRPTDPAETISRWRATREAMAECLRRGVW